MYGGTRPFGGSTINDDLFCAVHHSVRRARIEPAQVVSTYVARGSHGTIAALRRCGPVAFDGAIPLRFFRCIGGLQLGRLLFCEH